MDSESSQQRSNPSDFSEANLKDPDKWTRFAFMVFYYVLLNLVLPVIGVLGLVQFLFILLKSENNESLKRVNRWFIHFFRDSLAFMTYQTEKKPFPFDVADRPLECESGTSVKDR